MSNYVALLRGINVGGNRKVPMSELRLVFENLGFTSVSTFINSGNVIFSFSSKPDRGQIEKAIEARFGFAVDTLIVSGKQMRAITAAIPETWANNTEQKSDVLFLFPDVDSPNIVEKVGYRPELETMRYVPGALLFNVPRKNQSRSSLLKLMGTPLYRQVTIRNILSTRKIAALLQ